MATALQYILAAEAEELLALEMLSSDRRRVEFEELDEADQNVLLVRATADIDAVLWSGVDASGTQETRWPRKHESRPSRYTSGVETESSYFIDADTSPHASRPIANIPANVARACAVQAAWRAMTAAGLSASAHVEDAANRGVTSQSGGGVSESIDLQRANSPWAALCPDAQRLLRGYRRTSGAMV